MAIERVCRKNPELSRTLVGVLETVSEEFGGEKYTSDAKQCGMIDIIFSGNRHNDHGNIQLQTFS